MGVTTSNLIQGPATIYVGTFGATEPLTITEAPGVGWRDVGGTTDGLELTVEDEYADLTVDQLIMVPERRRTGRNVTAATNLAEATLENLAAAINNTPAEGGVLTLDDGLEGFQPAYQAIIVDGHAPGGKRRRVIIRKTLATESVGMAYKKDEQTVVPVTWSAHYVSPSIRAVEIEDEPAV